MTIEQMSMKFFFDEVKISFIFVFEVRQQSASVLRFKIILSLIVDIFFTRERQAVAQTCSVKKVFLEVLQNLQENICARVSILIKLQA